MKGILACVAVVGCISSVAAWGASCKHYEYEELKAMKRSELETTYCLTALDKKVVEVDENYARRAESLNSQRYSPDPSESMRNNLLAQQASDAADKCDNELDRMSRLLANRGTNILKLRKQCKLDD